MVYEGKNPNYAEIAKRQEYKDSGGKIHCGHDFWTQARKMEFGDVVLCQRCNQYFAKIKHAPWVVKPSNSFRWKGNKFVSYTYGDFHTNHLPVTDLDKYYYFMTPIKVRITD